MYDLVIIGSGPAGLTASIYASCFHLKHLVIGKELGGQMMLAPDILNYPGFEEISGKELTSRMVSQVKKRGGEIVTQSVTKIISRHEVGIHDAVMTHSSSTASGQLSNPTNPTNKPMNENNGTMKQWDNGNYFEIETQSGQKYQARSIILATGTERRKLNVPGEVEYTGKGVHYCATCERQDYDGKICAVVGGANAAVQAAVELSQAAAKVYIIYRGTQLRGDPIWLEQVEKNKKVEVIYNTVVTEIVGDGGKVTGVKLKPTDAGPAARVSQPLASNSPRKLPGLKQGEARSGDPSLASPASYNNNLTMEQFNNDLLPLDKLFIEIGGVPGTALVIPLGVKMDPGGYIMVNEKLETNIPGIFAAGDLISYGLSIEQISSAVGLGARAAASVFAYLKQDKAPTVWGKSQIKR